MSEIQTSGIENILLQLPPLPIYYIPAPSKQPTSSRSRKHKTIEPCVPPVALLKITYQSSPPSLKVTESDGLQAHVVIKGETLFGTDLKGINVPMISPQPLASVVTPAPVVTPSPVVTPPPVTIPAVTPVTIPVTIPVPIPAVTPVTVPTPVTIPAVTPPPVTMPAVTPVTVPTPVDVSNEKCKLPQLNGQPNMDMISQSNFTGQAVPPQPLKISLAKNQGSIDPSSDEDDYDDGYDEDAKDEYYDDDEDGE